MADRFRLGVIEGFFGKAWNWQARDAHAAFLAAQGFDSYLYAPKNDAFLRKHWERPWPAPHFDALYRLRLNCRSRGVEFGIGLSPFELYRDFSLERRELLKTKLEEINALQPDIVCVLFDDMMGDLEGLASTQLAIMDFVVGHCTASAFMLCPTYYSSDPRLEKLFGAAPEEYLEELGAGLDSGIGMFWTGPRVISTEYPREHLEAVAERMRRKPLLWDNYPVNDAQRLTSFLHLMPFERNAAELRELCAGHFSNPMNQAWLSQLPLYSLARLYQGADPAGLFDEACGKLCPEELASLLRTDAEGFQRSGLDAINADDKAKLKRRYADIDHPMAAEIIAWLDGEFVFDPACLT